MQPADTLLHESPSETLSLLGQHWLPRPHDAREALAISQTAGLSELMGRVLAGRGVSLKEAGDYLNPTLRHFLPDPYHLKDMEKAAKRVAEEIEASGKRQVAGENHVQPTIAIFGDYDVDGATSSALLIRYFRAFGIEPLVHIPDRMKEGYGPNAPALLGLKEKGAKLVITVDCGTMAHAPLATAAVAGLEVIVVDHHKGEAEMPKAYAVVNPNRADETSPHTQLAAVGVTFLLLVAVNKVLKARGVTVPDLLPLLDIVALGTICDVVPLNGVNHALVAQGLKIMRNRGNAGMNAVMDVAKLNEAPGTYHAGFILGPRINAGGRVGKSDLGVRLLSTEDAIEAADIARELDRFNAERKAIESLVQAEAMKDALALPSSDGIILVARQGWHPGVIGIVAGRLKEHFCKPAAVIALDGNTGKASARSITGIDLGAAVIAAVHEGLLLGGGGHMMAAGFSVTEDKIPALREFFNARLTGDVARLTHRKTLYIDGEVSLAGLNVELVRLLEQAGPFGAGNPSVRLQLSNVKVVNASIVGDGHVRAIFADAKLSAPSQSVKAMAFRSSENQLGQTLLNARGKMLHVAGSARINVWQGRESVDFFIDDVMRA